MGTPNSVMKWCIARRRVNGAVYSASSGTTMSPIAFIRKCPRSEGWHLRSQRTMAMVKFLLVEEAARKTTNQCRQEPRIQSRMLHREFEHTKAHGNMIIVSWIPGKMMLLKPEDSFSWLDLRTLTASYRDHHHRELITRRRSPDTESEIDSHMGFLKAGATGCNCRR